MKRLVKLSLILTISAALLSSCNCYKKMVKKASVIETKVNPEMLSVKGSTVTADVTVTFPAKYFNEEAVMRLTPVFVYEGGELAGTPKYVQGEDVKDNYSVISWKKGGSYTQTVSFPYSPELNLATLELRIEAKCFDNCRKKKNAVATFVPVAALTLAQGVSAVQNTADQAQQMNYMADNYTETTTTTQSADLMYKINTATVTKQALSAEQIKMFEQFVRDNSGKDRTTLGNIHAKGYASPDGPVDFNDKLSQRRSETAKDAISKQLKDVDVKYDLAAYGEDWEGFKKLVEASDIKDKDLILQVLQMYSSPVERDREIKNMSSVFQVLAKEILPKLRRTQIVVDADTENPTNAEIMDMMVKNPNQLNLEQYLYAADNAKTLEQKSEIYAKAAQRFNDARAYNNLGVTLAKMGDYAGAEQALDRAARLSNDPQINNNLAMVALANGDTAKARQYLSGAGASANDAKGLLALAEGDYNTAVRNLSGYNLAVAEVANGNLAKAKNILANDNSADAEYLKAVIATREGDTQGAVSYLKSAFAKKPSLKEKAQNDAEFAKLFSNPELFGL